MDFLKRSTLVSMYCIGSGLFCISILSAAEQTDGKTASNGPPSIHKITETQTYYAGTMRITQWIQNGEDETPPADRNLLPIRFTLIQRNDSTYSLTATPENFYFILFKNPSILKNGKLLFVMPEMPGIKVEFQIQNGQISSGKYNYNEEERLVFEGVLSVSTADPAAKDPFNGSFKCTVQVTEDVDPDYILSVKWYYTGLYNTLYASFVQVGDLTAVTFLQPSALLMKNASAVPEIDPEQKMTLASSMAVYVIKPYYLTNASGNSASFIFHDTESEHAGNMDIISYSDIHRFTLSDNVLTVDIKVQEERYGDWFLQGSDWVREIQNASLAIAGSGGRVGAPSTLSVKFDPPEIKCGEFATIEIRMVKWNGEVDTGFDGGAEIRLLNTGTKDITRLAEYQSVLIHNGAAPSVFVFTPKTPYSSNQSITSSTVLSGKVEVEVKLQNSSQSPVKAELPVKSPLDFYIDRIEIQQGVADVDKETSLEYKPGVMKTYPALPFVAEHKTALRAFIGYNNTISIPFSTINSIDGISADLWIVRGGKSDGPIEIRQGDNPFSFKDPFVLSEREKLEDALLKVLDPQDVPVPGNATFRVRLKLPKSIEEAAADTLNNKKERTDPFVGSKLYRILWAVGLEPGSAPFPVTPGFWNLIRDLYPIQSSSLTVRETGPFFLNLGFGRVTYQNLRLMTFLVRYNRENPGDQKDVFLLFALDNVITKLAGKSVGGFSFNSARCVLINYYPNNLIYSQLTIAHELGHQLGLRDTYDPNNYNFVEAYLFYGDPNPRRSNATANGNPVEDGNISFYNMRQAVWGSSEAGYLVYMGGGTNKSCCSDRVTWDYLFSQKLASTASGSPKRSRPGAGGYIAVSGMIGEADSVTLNPFVKMSQVPESDEGLSGNYAVAFEGGNGSILARHAFETLPYISEIGKFDVSPFTLYLPLPEGTAAVRILRRLENGTDKILIRRVFSSRPPEIRLLSPKSGRIISDTCTVRWTASDPDGDALSYAILYSPDGVQEVPLDVNVTGESFLWKVGRLPSSNGYVTVVASDGVNEARAKSDPIVLITGVDERPDERGTVPARYSLEQNYPNPFNGGTAIAFQIREEGWVRVHVMDIHGREIRTLVDEMKKPGVYRAEFDGSDLPSGVYVCRMDVTGHSPWTRSMKMILIK